MGHIFISYSRHDTNTVDKIARKLTEAGLDVWIDREDIKTGNTWRVQIVEAIDTCTAFLLILSRYSAISDNVRREIDLAQDSGRKLFVLRLEKVAIPPEIRYQLAGLQFAEVEELGPDTATQKIAEALTDLVSIAESAVQSSRQAELVIDGINQQSFTEKRQDALLGSLASLVNLNRSQLQIAGFTSENNHVFVDMPAPAAFELKTMALNNDKRFRKTGIKELRLNGNKRFIKVSLGILGVAGIIALLRTRWAKILFGSCSCFTCLVFAVVIAGRMFPILPGRIFDPPKTPARPQQTTIPQTVPSQVTRITDTPKEPTAQSRITQITPACVISVPKAFVYKGPSKGYFLATIKFYQEGDEFKVISSDRTGNWLFGELFDGIKGWIPIEWLSPSCYSKSIPTASFIPLLPPTDWPTPRPPSH